MIVREYYQNINVHKPRDYFERWYADVWARRIARNTARHELVDSILEEEIAQVGAWIDSKDRRYRYEVTFKNDHDYTMFVLRWS
jgi:hypothetical protein